MPAASNLRPYRLLPTSPETNVPASHPVPNKGRLASVVECPSAQPLKKTAARENRTTKRNIPDGPRDHRKRKTPNFPAHAAVGVERKLACFALMFDPLWNNKRSMPASRPRLLLTLLNALGDEMGNRDFQKLLFLYTQEFEANPSYDFVPFKYGGFSFTSYADRRRLIQDGFLVESEHIWKLTDEGRKAAATKGTERLLVDRFCRVYQAFRGNDLLKHAYKKHPYYAIRSDILETVLPDMADRDRVNAARPVPRSSGLVTIGYQGKSLEAYLNQLLADGVTMLCDVRMNPISRKYGFSRSTLSNCCGQIGIRYEHLPELGIASEQRQDLNIQADYDALFGKYERVDLPKQVDALERIARWIKDEGYRVALTCFEALPEQCHRHCVAEAVAIKLGRSGVLDLGNVCRKNVFLSR